MEKITINGVEYQPVNRDGEQVCIVVLDRGFVVVGRVTIADSYVTIRDCKCIRKWGTSRGLGEIASNGPTENTTLDPQPTTRVHEWHVVQMIECEASKWNL